MQIHVSWISPFPSQARNRSSALPFLAHGAREAAGSVRPQQAPRASAQPWCVGVAADREQPDFKELPKVACVNVLLNQSWRRRAALQPAESRAQSRASGFPHPGHRRRTRRSPHPLQRDPDPPRSLQFLPARPALMTGPGSFPSPSQSNLRELSWARSLSASARSSLPAPLLRRTGGHRGTRGPCTAPLCPHFAQTEGGKRPESARAPPAQLPSPLLT